MLRDSCTGESPAVCFALAHMLRHETERRKHHDLLTSHAFAFLNDLKTDVLGEMFNYVEHENAVHRPVAETLQGFQRAQPKDHDAFVVAVAVRQDVGVFLPGFNHEMQFWTKIIHWNDAASDVGDNIGLANSSGSLYQELFSF